MIYTRHNADATFLLMAGVLYLQPEGAAVGFSYAQFFHPILYRARQIRMDKREPMGAAIPIA